MGRCAGARAGGYHGLSARRPDPLLGGCEFRHPRRPGSIGTFEAAVADILGKFGATAEQGLAYALVCHMVMYLLVTGLGLALLYRVGLSLGDLRGKIEKK